MRLPGLARAPGQGGQVGYDGPAPCFAARDVQCEWIGARPLNPNFTTIITPIEPSKVEWCRGYLRDNADPQFGGEAAFLECRPLFPFDKIAGLHFCSFVILDAADGGGPCLVFEATFDGPSGFFWMSCVKYAPIGFDEVYRRCVGYPLSGTTTPKSGPGVLGAP